jgi:hypothetical protein
MKIYRQWLVQECPNLCASHGETVKTVNLGSARSGTPLKRGVNESGFACINPPEFFREIV